MAVDAPLLWRQRLLAAKVETTTGTAETLANADAAMNLFDAEVSSDIPFVERFGQSSLSRISGVPGARMARLTFSSHLEGLGGVGNPLWATTMLAACGMAESSQVYTPATGAAVPTTLTMGLYSDGRRRLVTGAVGNVTFNFTAGEPVVCQWEFIGVYNAPADAALLTPTYPTVIPPRFAGGTLTVGGTAYKISQMQINLNNVTVMRQDATTASGYHAGVVADRRVTVTMDPEAQLLATKNWHADWVAGTEAALSVVVGSATNNTMTFAAPKLQLTNVQDADRDGILVEQLEFQANRSAAAGDDELSLTFS